MEAMLLLFYFFVFGVASFIGGMLYSKFSGHPLRLIGIYLLVILLGVSILSINYWYMYRLNSLKIPFTAATGNELKFNFVPQYNGEYSIDIAFLNNEINKKYDTCNQVIYSGAGQSAKNSENDCKNALIFRAINADINADHFIRNLQYNQYSSNINWGYYNHVLKQPALHVYEFHGIKNIALPIDIKIDATPGEIQATEPAVVIGPMVDAYRNSGTFTFIGKVSIFIIFALPFIFSIILLLFKYLLIKIKLLRSSRY